MVEYLAEAGLSECGRYPEVPGCDFSGLEAIFLCVFVGMSALASLAWIAASAAATSNIRRTTMSRRRRATLLTAVWAVPILGPLAWAAYSSARGRTSS